MASPPCLLTLPREIRDKIYSFLHRDIKFKGPLYSKAEGNDRRYNAVHFRLRNAPLVNVLLTHSQLRNEYATADCFRRLSAVLRFGSYHFVHFDQDAHHETHPLILEALARAHDVTVTIDTIDNTDLSVLAHDFLKLITSHVTYLGSLRIVFWVIRCFVPNDHLNHVLRSPLATTMPLISIKMPDSVGKLPLAKRGRGFHVGYTFMLNYGLPTNKLAHKISHIAMYCYGSAQASNDIWSHTDLVAIHKPLEYKQNALSELPQDVASWLVHLSTLVLEWDMWDFEIPQTKELPVCSVKMLG